MLPLRETVLTVTTDLVVDTPLRMAILRPDTADPRAAAAPLVASRGPVTTEIPDEEAENMTREAPAPHTTTVPERATRDPEYHTMTWTALPLATRTATMDVNGTVTPAGVGIALATAATRIDILISDPGIAADRPTVPIEQVEIDSTVLTSLSGATSMVV